ncbi:sugar phosphate isomerase/epimerase family protein [Subtercola frigoramans]|uniref:Sugar phosphate isomerase/epimerase n=1 Tax=Subtercola frigoramans TaxID=120298 RepID=A0ABS2L1P4_9MICO|nr:TIM barrel protein [Subtercola frigoramans]MBM7470999.1 sugar phosphate isomerase/epimerase [Subtercola frigoramans]
MGAIAISSFSLFTQLGPLHFETRGDDGVVRPSAMDLPSRIDLEQFIALVPQETGLTAVELCQVQFGETTPQRLERLKAAFATAGVRLLTVPIDVGDISTPDAAHRDEDVLRIIDWLDIAQSLGARFARVRIGSPIEGADTEGSGLVRALGTLADEAARRHLELLVENHGGLSSDPGFLLSLQKQIGEDRMGILLDLGNFEPVSTVSIGRITGNPVDESGLDVEHIYKKIEMLAPHARLVHAKAIDAGADGEPLLDLDRSLAIVAQAGYDGDISIEWEGLLGDPWEQVRRVVERIRRAFPAMADVKAS